MSITLVFNVVDLFPYQSIFEPLVLPSSISAGTSSSPVPRVPCSIIALPDVILDVLYDAFIASHFDGYCRFLVRWKDPPITEYTWITEDEFRCLDPTFLESYLLFTSIESSSFQLGK